MPHNAPATHAALGTPDARHGTTRRDAGERHACCRSALAAAIASFLVTAGCGSFMDPVAGAWTREPEEMAGGLSPEARRLVDDAYSDVDPARMVDYHCHIVGMGEGGSGCYVNPKMLSWLHPTHRLKFEAYRSAGAIVDVAHAESQYLDRLLRLARTAKGRFLVLAFDEHRDAQGTHIPEKTEFHVPNDYAIDCATAHPGEIAAAGSVHPLRPGAIEELRRIRARGVRIIKWLPNAMGIDPADPRHAPFYDAMRELGIALLSHGGEEKAVEAEEDQCLGNPLHLRLALERGVKVIVAHCASLGEGVDTDDPNHPHVANWTLLLRMMDDPRWDGLLFADISAMTQANRLPQPMIDILSRPDLHHRLVNGSDYPLPAVHVVIRLGPLVDADLLDEADAEPLREIYRFHPLVFDYALKRRLRLRRKDGTVLRFPPSVFMEHPALPVDDR